MGARQLSRVVHRRSSCADRVSELDRSWRLVVACSARDQVGAGPRIAVDSAALASKTAIGYPSHDNQAAPTAAHIEPFGPGDASVHAQPSLALRRPSRAFATLATIVFAALASSCGETEEVPDGPPDGGTGCSQDDLIAGNTEGCDCFYLEGWSIGSDRCGANPYLLGCFPAPEAIDDLAPACISQTLRPLPYQVRSEAIVELLLDYEGFIPCTDQNAAAVLAAGDCWAEDR